MKCIHCGMSITEDGQGSWVDETDGDGCTTDEGVETVHEHQHEFGPFQHTRIAGTLVRRCSGCGVVSLDGDDDE